MFNEENAYPENCDKCRKPKFNAKHPIYCEEKCNIILVSVRCEWGRDCDNATLTELIF